MNRIHRLTVLLVLLVCEGCSGCGASSGSSGTQPLGRAIDSSPPPVGRAAAAIGDPLPERGGSVPRRAAREEEMVAAGAVASTSQGALGRYALAYVNWDSATLAAHLRRLAAMSIGPARLAALQTAAGVGAGGSALLAHRVRNTGSVLAVTPGEGAAQGRWVIVTQEQSVGTGAYAGLPPAPHVTLAQVRRVGGGWIVWGWWPTS